MVVLQVSLPEWCLSGAPAITPRTGRQGREFPDDARRLALARFAGQFDAFVPQPDVDLTHSLEFDEFGVHELQGFLDPLVRGLLKPLPSNFHIAGCDTEEQRSATRLLL